MGRKRNALLCALVAYGGWQAPAVAQKAPTPSVGPFFLTLHVAGGTGLVALGGGYRLAHQRLEPELLVGYLPRRLAGRPTAIITLKTTYLPFSPRLGHSRWELSPAAFGGMINYTTGRQYFLTNNTAGRYRPGYYWWSSAVRIGAFIAPRLTVVGHSGGNYASRTSLYSELSTNDLHLVSALTNHALKLSDILTLGVGVKRSEAKY